MGIIDIYDGMVLSGLALVTFGLWQIFPPIGLIFLGVAFISIGLFLARN